MENVEQMSMLEIAVKLMEDHEGLYNIYELIRDTLKAKGIDANDIEAAAQLYVDMTTSSKFVYMGEDMWDLKANQSLEQFDKDGSAFISKDEEYIDDEEDDIDSGYDPADDELEDDEEDDLDEEDDDDDSRSDYDDELEDEDDLDDEDDSEDDGELEDDEELESYSEEGFNEDKYNDLMDDYEDMYDDK